MFIYQEGRSAVIIRAIAPCNCTSTVEIKKCKNHF